MQAESSGLKSSTAATAGLPTLLRPLAAFATDIAGYLLLSSPLWYSCIERSWGERPVEGSFEYWATYASFIAYTSMELCGGRSPGKWLFGLSITGQHAGTPSFEALAVRWLIKYLPIHWMTFAEGFQWTRNTRGMSLAFLALLVGTSLVMVVLTKSRRAIHDVCARTRILRLNYHAGFPMS